MFIKLFLSWWYKDGWLQIMASLNSRNKSVANAFSVNQLLSTLFAPWRRIITYPGASLEAKFRAWSDNVFSRTIGFVIRLVVLLAALLTSLLFSLISLIEIVVWPIIPIGIIAGVVIGIVW